MHRRIFVTGLRLSAGAIWMAALLALGTATTGRAAGQGDSGLFADQKLTIPGSSNDFCGVAHSNGSIEIPGKNNGILGGAEYVTTFKSGKENTITGTQASNVPVPQPAHDLAFYRLQARTNGHYYTDKADLKDLGNGGLFFAEKDIHISASNLTGSVTLVSATGSIEFSGQHLTLTSALDEMLAYAATGKVAIPGSNNTFAGSIFAPANNVEVPGSNNSLNSGSIVGKSIAWPGSRNHLGDCCIAAEDCDDGNACTADACSDNNVCTHVTIDGCTACRDNKDCTAPNACTKDECHEGICQEKPVDHCACETAADCAPGDACTTVTCDSGQCAYASANDCEACTTAADCDDKDKTTIDLCNAQHLCEHRPGGQKCDKASDCNDGDACTIEACGHDHNCEATIVPACTACNADADCDDHDAATHDTCADGICRHARFTPPPAEVCNDGIDNDGDGLTDCADSDCASTEICGNIRDNSCTTIVPLRLRKMAIRFQKNGRRTRLGMQGLFAKAMPAGFDPLTKETAIQITDPAGEIFGTTISGGHFMPVGKHRVGFWSDGSFSNGLTDGAFTIRKNGRVLFITHGKNAQVRRAPAGPLTITVRVGNICAQETSNIRATGAGIVLLP